MLAAVASLSGATAFVDDRAVRRCAKALGIRLLGTLGVVLLARATGVVPVTGPIVEELRGVGLWLEDEITEAAPAKIGA